MEDDRSHADGAALDSLAHIGTAAAVVVAAAAAPQPAGEGHSSHGNSQAQSRLWDPAGSAVAVAQPQQAEGRGTEGAESEEQGGAEGTGLRQRGRGAHAELARDEDNLGLVGGDAERRESRGGQATGEEEGEGTSASAAEESRKASRSDRWRKLANMNIRVQSTFWMVVAFSAFVWMGHLFLVAAVLVLQVLSAKELFSLFARAASSKAQQQNLQLHNTYRMLNW